MTQIFVVPEFAGTQGGTKENPFVARDAIEFDALMREHAHLDTLDVHLNDGVFLTAGTREWDDSPHVQENPGFRLGRHWTFDTETAATVAWDVDAIPDERISDTPIHLFLSTEARFDERLGLHTPEDVWDLLPRGQAVRNLKVDLQFTKAVDRWKAKGKKLRIGAVLLSGHEAAVEHVHVVNGGAWGYEGFPVAITGGIGQYDRNLIARLDPAKYILDYELSDAECSHITDCVFDQYSPADTNDQVTVNMIVGNMGERIPGQFVQHMRAFCYQLRNRTIATGKNLVQGHTIYQALRGRIANNETEGAAVGVYGDFYSTKGLEISLNEFLGCDYAGIRFLLSPRGPGSEQYSHENYTIGPNKITSGGPNVGLDTLEDQMPTSPTRFIRNISVDASLSLEVKGATGVTRTGALPDPAGKGCLPGFLQRFK